MCRFARFRAFLATAAVLTATLAVKNPARAGDFPLKQDDVVVMLGDSITAQHLHTNYIEAYCVTRFPKWNLQFRNAGVNGDEVPGALKRLDYDVLCWKPTVVTIELGMNDAGNGPGGGDAFISQMGTLIQRIEAAGARPVLFTPSPVNNGQGPTGEPMKMHDRVLEKMANALVALAAVEKLPCADQFHALRDLWVNNANSREGVLLGGDGVHTGPIGQLTMAYACLTGLDAPSLVSSASIGPGHDEATGTNCAIKNLKWAPGDIISFERTDECLPMPLPDDARAALQLVPLCEKLSQYMLRVQLSKDHLPPNMWNVSIDGTKVATVSNGLLEKGWNMSTLTAGPIAAQCQKVLELIRMKQSPEAAYRQVATWRAPAWLNDPTWDIAGKKKAELDRLMKSVAQASEQIIAAAQPQPHQFVLEPAK